ncbi:MAG: Acetyl-CoA Acetyltransferase [Bradyrhizobium sp.]|nr:Acetyl-CoA Acetyltransferase [Bradyrhizobium sp.]
MVTSDRIPVIVGVGQINDRPASSSLGLDSLGLMVAALRAADADAGGGWLARLDSLAVVDQFSFPVLNPIPPKLSAELGATPRLAYQTRQPNGDSPILLLNEAANRIAAGEIEIAAVVGGEALRTAAARATEGSSDNEARYDVLRAQAHRRTASYKSRYGLDTPVDIYPLYENAGRASYRQTFAQSQEESGKIWSLFSQVAAEGSGAWITASRTVAEIVTPGPNNRLIAFPYTKLMVANSSVNQGAAFLVTSLAVALAAGVPEDRLVYVGRGAAAHEPADVLARDRFDRTPAMEVSLRRAMDLNGIAVANLDFVELYSCFPCVPKMARRVLGWPVDKPASVFGGLTFGGGPIGNYMSHAVVAMVLKLRKRGRKGLLFANGGYATHNHSLVLGRDAPPAGFLPCSFDFQAEADRERAAAPVIDEDYEGPGEIETYTVLYTRNAEPRFGVIVARTPYGARFLAKIPGEDSAGIAFLTDGRSEPIGTKGSAARNRDGDLFWSIANGGRHD